MVTNKYKLLCIDVDGTLADSNKNIPYKNIQAIKKLYAEGINIAIASGRSPWSVQQIIDYIGIDIYGICLNGSYVKDKHTEIFKHVFTNDELNKILQIVLKYDLTAFFSTTDFNIVKRTSGNKLNNKSVVEQKSNIICTSEDISSKVNQYKNSILKVSIYEENKEIYLKMRKDFEGIGLFEVEKSDLNYLDINSLGINKASGMKQLAKYLNINLNEVAAIGDNENDIEMLGNCGFPIAMGNSCLKVKEISKIVTLSNDECGVAQAICDYIL